MTTRYEELYTSYNDLLFESSLPTVPIIENDLPDFIVGQTNAKYFKEGYIDEDGHLIEHLHNSTKLIAGSINIVINKVHIHHNLTVRRLLPAILIHEMIHVKQFVLNQFNDLHAAEFLMEAERIEKICGFKIPIHLSPMIDSE